MNHKKISPNSQCNPTASQVAWFIWALDAGSWCFYLIPVYLYKYERLSALCPQSNCLGLSPNYLNTFSKQDIKTED